jgi:crotonobetainyl-CoA:carnitine CoA-transferase CaiB-like acyl-CoA transferase
MEKLFDGLKVLDFTTNIAGPVVGSMFADFGADVIKVEKPVVGEEGRLQMPEIEGRSVVNLWLNRGKRSLAVPLNNPQGLKIVNELVKHADVVIQGFRPGVMKKFALDYESVSKFNPKIIYCSISMFGQEGPLAGRAGYDVLAQAMVGMMDMTGEADGPPMRNGLTVIDYNTANCAFGGIAAALYYREKSGVGQQVDISLFNVGLAMNHHVEATGIGHEISRSGNISRVVSPCGVYTGRYGSLALQCASPNQWKRLCECMNRPGLIDHPEFNTSGKRLKNNEVVTAAILAWMDSLDSIDAAEKILINAGLACAKVRSIAEAIDLGVEAGNGMITDMPTPDDMQLRSIKSRGVHIVLSKTPGKIGKGCPSVGEHNREIFENLGYPDKTIDELNGLWTQPVHTRRVV